MTYRKVAFCVVNPDYMDPAIVSLTSWFRFNSVKTICYVEAGGDYKRLQQATAGEPIEFRECSFPELFVHRTMGGKHFDLFCSRKSLPAYAMRIKALEELKTEADIIVNFDLDTLFFNSVQNVLNKAKTGYIYGVSERKNRDKWTQNLHITDIAPFRIYINTGFVIYGAEAVKSLSLSDYEEFLKKNQYQVYCPEQDYINCRYHERIVELPNHYNAMFTDENYVNIAPVMIHFVGSNKPWSESVQNDYLSTFYFRRYLIECHRNKDFVDDNFYELVQKKVSILCL